MKKRVWSLATLLAVVMLSANMCTTFPVVDLSAFQTIPLLENLDFSGVRPGASYDYWELRFAMGGEDTYQVVGTGGRTNLTQIPTQIVRSFQSMRSTSGFDVECLPGYCFKYIASLMGNQAEIWNTAEDLVQFLGEIDSYEDAILVAAADGYNWEGIIEGGAIRRVPEGYQLIAQRLVNDCDPVQTNRFLFNVTRSGSISILGSEIWTKMDGACI